MIVILNIFKLAWYINSEYQITLAKVNVEIMYLQLSIINADRVRGLYKDIEQEKD